MAIALFIMLATASSSHAQFTTLVSFTGTNGNQPFMENLVQSEDGNLYGTTTYGGTSENGIIFKVTPTGTLTTIHNFAGTPDGANPYGGLVLGTDGKFYGTTYQGGTNGLGTVFKITSSGTLTILHNFGGSDGELPECALVQGSDGKFYGTTEAGGTHAPPYGTVFKITSSGTFTSLHSFTDSDGQQPEAALVQGSDGKYYGTTAGGGASNFGTVFKITSTGTFTSLHSFNNTDGWEPQGVLIQTTDGKFYGTTPRGGVSGDGTAFKITSSGTFTSLHSFNNTDGLEPVAGLAQATDGNFYGTTFSGGTFSEGTIFEMTSGGTITSLHSFSGGAGGMDGNEPFGGLVQHTSGVFFGTTGGASSGGLGTVFSLGEGLKAFVKTVPTSGKVGSAVTILGTSLTGSTSVTFNGTAAAFTVVSASEIATTVPTGATTGKVKVVTPGSTVSSNVPFTVK
jgi:uncharacterized repeat protein (TIGR03803 family)